MKRAIADMWNVPTTSLPCHSNPVFQLQRLYKDYKPLSQYILVSQCETSVPLFNDDLICILTF